jgi:hypothetical protein
MRELSSGKDARCDQQNALSAFIHESSLALSHFVRFVLPSLWEDSVEFH